MTLVPGTHRRGSGWLSTSPLEPKLSPEDTSLTRHGCRHTWSLPQVRGSHLTWRPNQVSEVASSAQVGVKAHRTSAPQD